MERYDSYKDSGVEWIGEIPEGWQVVELKHKYYFETGFTPSTDREDYYDEDGIPWVTIADMHSPTIKDTKSHIAQKYIDEFNPSIIPCGSLLYSFKLSVGLTSILNCDAYTNEAIASFKPNVNPCLEFLKYSSFQILNSANRNIYGAYILNSTLIANASIVFPPLNEQVEIAAFLDNKTSQIDSLIEKNKKSIELLEEYRKSIISEAVTKGLDPNVPKKDSGVEWIGKIPEGWHVDKARRLFDQIGSGTTPKSDDSSYYDGEYFWIQSGDLGNVYLENTAKSVTNKALERYSALKVYRSPFLVVAMYGASIGNSSLSLVDACVNQACCVLAQCAGVINYYKYSLIAAASALVDMGIGGGQPNISQDKIKSFKMPCPSEEEQRNIVHYLDQKTAQIDSLIDKKKQLIEKLAQYRKSLISECVTGKIKVPGVE